MIKKIVVPVDGSAPAFRAVDWAADLAVKYAAQVVILNVMSKHGAEVIPEELRGLAEIERIEITEADLLRAVGGRIAASAADRAYARGPRDIQTVVEVGNPAKVIVEYARTAGADLIVMGRRGLGQAAGLLMGSVSSKVNHLAECACLTVK